MRAAIYTRISDARDDDTTGVDRQEEDCRALVDQRGWSVEGVYCDNNRSATTGVRPEYRRLLDGVRAGEIDVVVTWSTDRLYRRMTDLEEIVTVLGAVPVVTVKSGQVDLSTADGKTVARILGSIAQGEVEKRGERVARAARQRAEAGRFGGGPRRFGYNPSSTALDHAEAEAIKSGYERVLAGDSLREIARDWTARGLAGPTGAAFYAGSVKSILLRPVNAGIAVYKGEVVGRSLAPVIVDEDTFRSCRAILTDPKRRSSPVDARRTLLSGVLACGVCGAPVRAHTRHWPGRTGLSYACINRHVSRSRGKLDEAISDLVIAYVTENRATYREAPKSASKAANSAADEAEGYRQQLTALGNLMGAGELDPTDYARATRGLRDRLADADARLARHAGTPATAKFLLASDIEAAWAAASDSTKRTIIREVVESITLPVGTPGRFSMVGVKIKWRLGAGADDGDA